MTANFDEHNDNPRPSNLSPAAGNHFEPPMLSPETPDNLKRDRFELLSAYLDGEVTPDERRQVEEWLKTDQTVQKLYSRLLKLRGALRDLPIPTSEQPVEHMVQQVVSRLERKPKKRVAVLGGLALVALFVSALMSLVPRDLSPQMASTDGQDEMASRDGLMIALDRPIIEIPKPAVSGEQNDRID
jgi:anti-sigma factor RsiW